MALSEDRAFRTDLGDKVGIIVVACDLLNDDLALGEQVLLVVAVVEDTLTEQGRPLGELALG